MNKKHELFEILKEVKRGNKMAAEAYDEILLLFDVVGSEAELTFAKEAYYAGWVHGDLEMGGNFEKWLESKS